MQFHPIFGIELRTARPLPKYLKSQSFAGGGSNLILAKFGLDGPETPMNGPGMTIAKGTKKEQN